MKITNIFAYQIYDSRGFPTVACEVTIDDKYKGLAFVPSGASTGEKEAVELRDKNQEHWMGKGVELAVKNVNSIIKNHLLGFDPLNQKQIDEIMINLDKTPNKSNLGANAILAVSLANAKASANALGLELYQYIRKYLMKSNSNEFYGVLPLVNVVNGGQHANNNLDFQEFMFVPLQPKSWFDTLKIVSECFLSLQQILKNNNKSIAKGDEGGFSIDFDNVENVFELLLQAIKDANYVPGVDVGFALDVAASEFYDDGYYYVNINNKKAKLSPKELMEWYETLIRKYPIVSIEDPFDENDWTTFSEFTSKVGNKVQIVGDDLYCTNYELLSKGIQIKATNAILIKLNQIGTLTESLRTIELAQQNNINVVVSHRSGETEDTFIADLAIAVNAKQIKTGSMSRSERLAKYNRITYIDHNLKNELVIPTWKGLIK